MGKDDDISSLIVDMNEAFGWSLDVTNDITRRAISFMSDTERATLYERIEYLKNKKSKKLGRSLIKEAKKHIKKVRRKEQMSSLYDVHKNGGESLVYDWLSNNNWNPTKIVKAKGAPDFKCSKNRWVEAKGVFYGSLSIGIAQLAYWQTLLDDGGKVFLMFYDTKNNLVSTPLDVCYLSLEALISAIDNMSKMVLNE